MRILGMVAENYKRLRLVEVAPNGRMVIFSGRPDQGKTSAVDAVFSALGGKRFTQDMPVRKGAKNAKLRVVLGTNKVDWSVQRTIAPDGSHSLVITDANGQPQGRGQSILDDLRGDICMDPTEFIRMKPKEQVEILRKVSKLEIDVDALNAENQRDFDERTAVGREVRRLEGELSGMTCQEGLPAAKVDEGGILARLNAVSSDNKKIEEDRAYKAKLGTMVVAKGRDVENTRQGISRQESRIADVERELDKLRASLVDMQEELKEEIGELQLAQAEFDEALEPSFIDVSAITKELQDAQLVNREIDKRDRRKAKADELAERRRDVETLTRAIDNRNEKKAAALSSAKMPVEGLTFDENQVLMNGIPLQQLGESQQIRICTRIAMAENPKLRVLPVMHGESLGEEGIAMLAAMAEEQDFQVWIAMVDESGKRGYVIEDGMVSKDNG